ncbi:unnamed protein product [Periconia digitata]|uniref:Zn(2)-C6 fungal-type domain-containing protein n=1 Tax=Periconia digitata TaxID=1303443 RepID=A0A9W4UXJ7_9PLEO|nr:unnamed protein product [Periconia digitata]
MMPTIPLSEVASPARDSNDSSVISRKQVVACQRCKLRKARCDRQLPKCERCRDAGVLCEYARTRRPPGFPVGHRQLLEDKIRRLEGEITRLNQGNGLENTSGQDNTSPLAINPCTSIATMNSAVPQANITHSGTCLPQDREDSQDPDEAPSNLGQDSDSADDSPSWREQPPTSTVARTRRIKELKPPDDLVLSLTSLYFHHIHHWLPFLDVRHIFGDHVAVGEPSLITYALFGATLQYSQDPRLTQSSRDAFWKYCKRTIMVEALEEPSYHTLEALAVLALDISGLTNGPQAWGVLAVVVKMAEQLDVGGSKHALRASTATEEALRSSVADMSAIPKLFWAIYAIDCYVAITTRHASSLSSQAIRNWFPFRSALWNLQRTPLDGISNSDMDQTNPDSSSSGLVAAPTAQVIFSYQLELLDICKSLHSLYIEFVRFETSSETPPDGWIQSVTDWSHTMETWFTQLPSILRISIDETTIDLQQQRRISPLIASLNIYYYALRIYLHGLGDFMTHQPQRDGTHFASFADDNRLQCVKSLEKMTGIAGMLLPKGPYADKLGWPIAWALWVGGRYCLASRYRNRPLAPHYFKRVINALRGLSRYWQVASHYLRLLHISQSELITLGTPGNQKAPSDLLLSVVDWRVASSEVEDMGRVDPILCSSGLAPLEKGIDYINMQMMLAGPAMGVTHSHNSYNEIMREPVTDWFPLSSWRQEQEEIQQTISESHNLNHM